MIIRPHISLIVVADNDPTDTIETVLTQNFFDFEILVLDRKNQIPFIKDPRVKWISCNQETLPKAYNQGIRESQGELLGFLTDAVRWEPYTLEKLYVQFKSRITERGFVYGAFLNKDQLEGQNSQQIGQPWKLDRIKYSNSVPLHAALVRRKAIETVGGFDEQPHMLPYYDWDFWWRISRRYLNKSIPNQLGYVHNSQTNQTDRSWQKTTIRNLPFKNSQQTIFGLVKCAFLSLYQSPLCTTKKGLHAPIRILRDWILLIKPRIYVAIKYSYNQIRKLKNCSGA